MGIKLRERSRSIFAQVGNQVALPRTKELRSLAPMGSHAKIRVHISKFFRVFKILFLLILIVFKDFEIKNGGHRESWGVIFSGCHLSIGAFGGTP